MNEGVLGRTVAIPTNPDEFQIDTIPNPSCIAALFVRFTCPEFTSLCPRTGQPDFATIIVDYVPRHLLVESKALKLFLFSFRNHGAFHEACVDKIGSRLWVACSPYWLRVVGIFNPRGGIPIDVVWLDGEFPEHFKQESMLPIDYKMFRGR